jgi:hypothetical protein
MQRPEAPRRPRKPVRVIGANLDLILDVPVVELCHDDGAYPPVSVENAHEVRDPDHQCLHAFHRDHARGTFRELENSSLAHELPWAALSYDAVSSVPIDADLGTAAEDDDHGMSLVTFGDEAGSGCERAH